MLVFALAFHVEFLLRPGPVDLVANSFGLVSEDQFSYVAVSGTLLRTLQALTTLRARLIALSTD
jgi:hypothetical protein